MVTGRGVGTSDCENEIPFSVCKFRSPSFLPALSKNPKLPFVLRSLFPYLDFIAITANEAMSFSDKISGGDQGNAC